MPAIHAYIESVQLAPASTAHHHAGPGGLATHTLDVIERALRQRKSFELPLNAGPEAIFEQDHYWTYAVFIAALLHDIGKMTTNTRIVLDNGKVWNPHQPSLLSLGAKHYSIRFDKNSYRQHTQIANTFFHLIPSKGRGWIAELPHIFTELCAWLYGDHYEFGIIGQIVRFADGQSVAANLKIGGERQRFRNAPEIPLIEKLMTALRELIHSGELKINGTEGSSGWNDGQFTYLVCGTVADKVRSYLRKMGSTDIPEDNNRLFDIWQEHGYAISNQNDAAIWLIKVDNRMKLTALKFETSRIFHPSKRPGRYSGEISVIDNRREQQNTNSATNSKPLKPDTKSALGENKSLDTNSIKQSVGTNNETDDEIIAPDRNDDPFADTEVIVDQPTVKDIEHSESETGGASTTQQTDSITDEGSTSFALGTATNAPVSSQNSELEQIDDTTSTDTDSFKSELPENIELKDPDIAKHFLTWIREGLRERKILVNNSKSLVHVAKEGALLVTPIAFKKFIWEFELDKNGATNVNKAVERVQNRLRAYMEKKKVHLRSLAGTNIHTYKINGKQKSGRIKCWIVPLKYVFGNTKPPSINEILENISGFENRKSD